MRTGEGVVHSYRFCGLAIDCELALPGLHSGADHEGPADITIRRAAVPESLDGASDSGPTWQRAGERFLLHIRGVARFLLRGGRDIAFEPEAAAEPDDVAIFLIGTVLGILLHQRGQIVLHASAVRVGGKAVLFCGPSGAGKSTLAAALSLRGYPVLNDDACAIAMPSDGPPQVYSDGRKLKLWAQSIDNLDLAERRGAPVRAPLQKYYVESALSSVETLPLGAVYALRETTPLLTAGIQIPNVVDTALLLRRNAYRPLLINRLNQKAAYFRAATTISNAVGVFHLTRPFDFAAMPETIAMLENHWQDAALIEQSA